jgi:hypothetical protein
MRTQARRMGRALPPHAAFEILDANSDGDDLLLGGTRIPMLRQQESPHVRVAPTSAGRLCEAAGIGHQRPAGAFATPPTQYGEADKGDVYQHMMAQILAERGWLRAPPKWYPAGATHLQGLCARRRLSLADCWPSATKASAGRGLPLTARLERQLHPLNLIGMNRSATPHRERHDAAQGLGVGTDVCPSKSFTSPRQDW